jgi:hypothetical protein
MEKVSEMKCPICLKPLLMGQTATQQNGLQFHSGCYANSLKENEKRQNEQFAKASSISRYSKNTDLTISQYAKMGKGEGIGTSGYLTDGKRGREEGRTSNPSPPKIVGCCDDAIKTMLAANRQAIDISNIAVICLTCNKVWHTDETEKVERGFKRQ